VNGNAAVLAILRGIERKCVQRVPAFPRSLSPGIESDHACCEDRKDMLEDLKPLFLRSKRENSLQAYKRLLNANEKDYERGVRSRKVRRSFGLDRTCSSGSETCPQLQTREKPLNRTAEYLGRGEKPAPP